MSVASQAIEEVEGMSKLKLAAGAVGLFLFIVGVKRTFEVEEHGHAPKPQDTPAPEGSTGSEEK